MVQVDGSQGFQAGDNNIQVNLFYGEHSLEAVAGGPHPAPDLRRHAGLHHG